jgi:hypothetical protein
MYTVREVADDLKFSVKTIRRLVKDDPDVIKLQGPGLHEGTAKRVHVTLHP